MLSEPASDKKLVPSCDDFAGLFANKIFLIHSDLEAKLRADPVPAVSVVLACIFVLDSFELILPMEAGRVLDPPSWL